jgi:RES domain-containing protein
MEVFRLSREIHGRNLSGIGAALQGGRWNSKGTEIIYTAANRSLAMAEVVVHISIGNLPEGFMMMTIAIPDDVSMEELTEEQLPPHWNQFPPLKETKRYGDQFISAGIACVMKVPSAVTKGDFNFLINPAHPQFKKISISAFDPFPFDNRLFKI